MQNHLIINIGRQCGSGGKSIATLLGEKLDIRVYDNSLLVEAARRSGLTPDVFRQNDERKSLWGVSGIIDSTRYGNFTSNPLSESELFRIQSETIRRIAREGSAIFVGRASNYVLRDLECLDVFIWAPLDIRKAHIAERLNLSPEEAASLIRKQDKGREKYYNFFTFGHWGAAKDYDLCIDSSLLGYEGTADLIIEFARRRGLR